jgi:exosortase
MNPPADADPRRPWRGVPWAMILLLAAWCWAIWSCAEHWQANPNYSYGWAVPLLATGFALRRYWRLPQIEGVPGSSPPSALQMILAVGAAVVVFALEYWREQMWHPEIVLWSICSIAVLSTLAIFHFRGGPSLARAEVFPVAFFLTAVPWPPRFEQPLTTALMKWVAVATTELLHWFGIEAQTSGGAIALRSGLVGITEACSGVRSMQAGIMFGLAMGEWLLLRPMRRIVLLAIAVVLALATNLVRTFALSLEAQRHGVDSLDRVHDFIGNVMITALIVGIWVAGKLLSKSDRPVLTIQQIKDRSRTAFRHVTSLGEPVFRLLVLSFLIGIIAAWTLTARIEAQDRTQTSPFFAVKKDNSNEPRQLSRQIWNELRPTTADYIHRNSVELPGDGADCFHFFWKPSPWNRFVLVHRPDICMPGIGWIQSAPAESVTVQLNGEPIQCQLFRFRRGNVYALELWGVWRNGQALSIDYEPAQVLGAAPLPSSLHFEGKRRSATEIVACTIIAQDIAPSSDIAVALLQSVFEYKPR